MGSQTVTHVHTHTHARRTWSAADTDLCDACLFMLIECVSTHWLRMCLHRNMFLDPHSSEGAALLRPLKSREGIPEMRNLHVCWREDTNSFEEEDDQIVSIQTLLAFHFAGVKCHSEYVSECSLIVASEDCQPELVGEERGGKRYRWADGQEWTASLGFVDHRVCARDIVCLMCVCTLPNHLYP